MNLRPAAFGESRLLGVVWLRLSGRASESRPLRP